MRLPTQRQTYVDLKLHFTAPHTGLCATNATVDELGYHRSSAIVAQIVEQLHMTGV